MSKTIISVERVNSVESHPNADRLDIVQVLGFQIITQKGNFTVGDLAVYFPPDILIPPDVAETMGVTNFLKHAIFPGDTEKTQCRVGAARIRNVPSHGFCVPASKHDIPVVAGTEIGADVTDLYKAHKYIAPPRNDAGESLPELSNFHTYTDIDNVQRYPDAFQPGSSVIITEKIHGTNCRLGLVKDEGEFTFCAGSHKIRRKPEGIYWEFMTEDMMNLLTNLCNEQHDVIVFGEIFGPGIQDLDYGQTEHAFRVFDVSINGVYMDYWRMDDIVRFEGLQCVPRLFTGEYSIDTVNRLTAGRSEFKDIRNKFKDKEGCVIRPDFERYSDVLGGRLIAKSVSADYRDRKGAVDVE